MDDFKQQLAALGWRIERNHMQSQFNAADWYAWRPVKHEARQCESNQKRMSLILWPSDYYPPSGPRAISVKLELCGEVAGDWCKVQAYSLPVYGLLARIDDIEARLVAAWNALAPATAEA